MHMWVDCICSSNEQQGIRPNKTARNNKSCCVASHFSTHTRSKALCIQKQSRTNNHMVHNPTASMYPEKLYVHAALHKLGTISTA